MLPERSEHGREYISIDNPAVLIRFVGYVKRQYARKVGGQVYFRGQTEDNGRMIPSLFRGVDRTRIARVYDAHCKLMCELRKVYPQRRLRTRQLGALLQHYGLRTPWLDLVDNLYTALWFASRSAIRKPGSPVSFELLDEPGWLFLVGTRGDGHSVELQVADFRVTHSSLTLRPHAQHGIAITRHSDTFWDGENCCLNEYVLAAVKISPQLASQFLGTDSNHSLLFPSCAADHTFRLFSSARMRRALGSISNDFEFDRFELGEVTQYA